MGNKAAVFPLQLLGFDVDVINSVHFSNHTGHPRGFKGDVLNGDQLRSILTGLEENGLLENIGHLLTGYIGSESFLKAILDVLKKVREKSKSVRFVCDPVMGDNGKFYVPPELVAAYRDQVIPQADVVTPNQFEVEQITGIVIKTQADALRACHALHNMGPSLVFITSMVLDENDTEDGDSMAIIASQRRELHAGDQNQDEVWRIDTHIVPGYFTGTGDLCAALLLGHTSDSYELSTAIEKVTNTMYAVISRTAASSGESVTSRELKLVQSKKDIEDPPQAYTAYKVSRCSREKPAK